MLLYARVRRKTLTDDSLVCGSITTVGTDKYERVLFVSNPQTSGSSPIRHGIIGLSHSVCQTVV